jgi:hypothetical protein
MNQVIETQHLLKRYGSVSAVDDTDPPGIDTGEGYSYNLRTVCYTAFWLHNHASGSYAEISPRKT